MTHPLSRTDVRLGLAALAVVVGVVGVGAFIMGGSEAARPLGPGISIAVVAPVEPEVLPGETMEVGALNDGFDRAALERAAAPPVDDTYTPEPAWLGPPLPAREDTPRMPMPTPVREVRVIESAPRPADPLADGSRSFGFDKPRPDYAEERRVRWERIEAGTPSATATTGNEAPGPVQYSSE
ncbi:hypothetical protein ACETK8_19075 [Brevundimonas staleyi]|uniref:SPOR domain-containing protein n=1 Tax=Brevundimonas staleyi TaxID=74326 RepID=A0ABW0FQP7_9CAUL